MARLDSASRLRWPRRIMVSMVSLRNRLAAAPSPSSPVRSRYSQAIWKESSSSWERETVMGGKRTRTARVPCHLRFADYWPRSNTVPSRRTKGAPPIFQGPAGEFEPALLLADIPVRDTKLFRTMCVKSGGLDRIKITRPTRSKFALGAFVLPDTDDRGECQKGDRHEREG